MWRSKYFTTLIYKINRPFTLSLYNEIKGETVKNKMSLGIEKAYAYSA